MQVHRERLRQVREARGVSPGDLAKAIGVTRQSVYGYERGSQEPRMAVLERMAEYLGVPVRLLLRAPTTADGPIFFRSLSSATKRSRARVHRHVEWLLEALHWLADRVELPDWQLPSVTGRNLRELADPQFVEKLATELREEWKLGNEPIHDVVALLESRGVVFTRLPLDEARLDAFSTFSRSLGRGVGVLNADKEAAVRSRLDAAHEAFHMMTHARMQGIADDFWKDAAAHRVIEEPAKRFPMAFLFPERAFRDEVRPHSSLKDLLELKPRWGTSVQAMVMRGYQLGVFDEHKKISLFKTISYRGWRSREPLDDQLHPEQPSLLRASIGVLLEDDPQAVVGLTRDMGMPTRDVAALFGVPEQALEMAPRPIPLVRARLRRKGGKGSAS